MSNYDPYSDPYNPYGGGLSGQIGTNVPYINSPNMPLSQAVAIPALTPAAYQQYAPAYAPMPTYPGSPGYTTPASVNYTAFTGGQYTPTPTAAQAYAQSPATYVAPPSPYAQYQTNPYPNVTAAAQAGMPNAVAATYNPGMYTGLGVQASSPANAALYGGVPNPQGGGNISPAALAAQTPMPAPPPIASSYQAQESSTAPTSSIIKPPSTGNAGLLQAEKDVSEFAGKDDARGPSYVDDANNAHAGRTLAEIKASGTYNSWDEREFYLNSIGQTTVNRDGVGTPIVGQGPYTGLFNAPQASSQGAQSSTPSSSAQGIITGPGIKPLANGNIAVTKYGRADVAEIDPGIVQIAQTAFADLGPAVVQKATQIMARESSGYSYADNSKSGPGGTPLNNWMFGYDGKPIRDANGNIKPNTVAGGYGTIDYGLFQINSSNFAMLGLTPQAAIDPYKNAAAARQLYNRAGGFSPWGVQ